MKRQKKMFKRSKNDVILGGVFSGLGEYLDINPWLLRILYLFITFETCFTGVLIYLLMWIFIPEE